MAKWNAFPHDNSAFTYDGASLEANWARLHQGDQEPFPSAALLESQFAETPDLAKATPGFSGDFQALSAQVQDAWRAYHRGDFDTAVKLGDALGPIGAAAANKAQMIYATYLEDSDKAKLTHFEQIIERADRAQAALPNHANSYYFQAYAQGRYSQEISIAQALTQGLAGKVKVNLEKTLKLAPKHAEAHIAMGAYHAEVIDKVGALVGGMTYGVKKETSLEHYEEALKLIPFSAIARLEYGSGLIMLFGNKKMKDAEKLYQEAAGCDAMEAMEALDIAFAQSEI